MEDSLESPPPEENAEERIPKYLKYKKHLVIGGAVLALLTANAVAIYVLYQKMLPAPVPVTLPTKPAETALPSQPIQPMPTKEQLEEAARLARQRKQGLIEAHQRILAEDPHGVINELPQVKPVAKKVPPPTAVEPASKPVEPKSTPRAETSEPAKKSPIMPTEQQARETPEAKPSLTPMGRLGYGVSKDNMEDLTTVIDAMNQVDTRKDKKKQ